MNIRDIVKLHGPRIYGVDVVDAQITHIRPDGTIDCLAIDPAGVSDVFFTGVRPKAAWELLPMDSPDRNLPYFEATP